MTGRPGGEHDADIKTVGSSVVGGMFYFVSGSVARVFVQILLLAILARLLGPVEYGLMGAAGIVTGFAELFSISGMVLALVHRKKIEERHIQTAFSVGLLIGTGVGLIVAAASGPAATFFKMPDLQPILLVLSLIFPINAFSAVSGKLLERNLHFGRVALINFLSHALGYGAVAVTMAFSGFGVWSLVGGTMAAGLLRLFLNFYFQPHSLKPSFDRKSYKELMSTGLGYSLARIINYFALKADYFVVGRWLGPAALGLYQRSYALMDMSNTLLMGSMYTVLFPAFAKMQDDKAALAHAFSRGTALQGLLFAPCTVACVILAPEIIYVLLGPSWSAAVVPFQILVAGMFFRTGYKMGAILVSGVGAVYSQVAIQLAFAVFVAGGAWLVLDYGIVGVACSTLVALGVVYVLTMRTALGLTGMTWAQVFRLFRPAVFYSGVVLISVGVAATGCRQLGLWGPAVLGVALASGAAVSAGAAAAFPRTLGPHGSWIFSKVASLRHKLSRYSKS